MNEDNPTEVTARTGSTFQINNAKLDVPLVTFSINDNIKFLENMKQGFRRTDFWNKYRSEITAQPKNIKLDYMIDPTFRNIDRLFILSFKNGCGDTTRTCFDEYCMVSVDINNFNGLIENKPFFHQLVKNKQEAYKKLCSKQTNTTILQRINFK